MRMTDWDGMKSVCEFDIFVVICLACDNFLGLILAMIVARLQIAKKR